MRGATEYLIATRQAERALKAGNGAPAFRLRDQRGVEAASETLLRHGPLLLTFYTGSWCPACSRDLHAFESLRPSVEARGASLVSISQQTVAENAKAHAQLKLGFPIPSDRGGRLVIDEVLFRPVAPYSRNSFGRATDLGDEIAVSRLAPALGHELPQDGLDFVFVLVLRDPARTIT